MKKLKFLKIFLISFAVFCTISIGAVSSYLFFADVASSQTPSTWIDDGNYLKVEHTKNVYTITTPGELAYIAILVNGGQNLNGYTINLAKDIDLSGHNWVPIGKGSNNFQGTFNGQGHTISGLEIEGSYEYAGLFGQVDCGTITNVVLSKPTLTISGGENDDYSLHVGSVAGYLQKSTIEKVIVDTPQITAYHAKKGTTICAGGAVGYMQNSSTVSRCYVMGSSGNVQSIGIVMYGDIPQGLDLTLYFGGVVGKGYDSSKISLCYSNVMVGAKFAKLAGYSGVISYNNVKDARAGGIAGVLEVDSTIDQCYNTGNITSCSSGASYSGGICGYQEGGTISNCYNTGEVAVSGAGCDSPIWYEQDEFKDKFYEISSGGAYYKSVEYTILSEIDTCYVYKSKKSDDRFTRLKITNKNTTRDINYWNPQFIYTPIGEKSDYGIVLLKAASLYQNLIKKTIKCQYMTKGKSSKIFCNSEYQPVTIKKYKGYTGGIVAYIDGGTIYSCYNSGKIDSTNCTESRTYTLGYCLSGLYKAEDITDSSGKVINNYSLSNLMNYIKTTSPGIIIDINYDVSVNSGNICGYSINCYNRYGGGSTIYKNYAKSGIDLNLKYTQTLKYCSPYSAYLVDGSMFFWPHYTTNATTNLKEWKTMQHQNVDCVVSGSEWRNCDGIAPNNNNVSISNLNWNQFLNTSEGDVGGKNNYSGIYYTTYLTLDFSSISQIKLNAQVVNGHYNKNNNICYETIDTGIEATSNKITINGKDYDTFKYFDSSDGMTHNYVNDNGNLKKVEEGCTIASSISASDLGSDYWAVDSTKVINGGMPYLKEFYW